MTKLKIYIDFEAITNPFSKHANVENDFPYAYTLGIYVGKKFKTKTYVFNFQNYHTEDVYDMMGKNIINDVRRIIDQKRFKLNESTAIFVGWNPNLENKVLDQIFPGVEVKNLNPGKDLSLSRLTPEVKSDYFEYVRKLIAKYLSKNFITKRVMSNDGAIAAYVGYLLHAQIHNKKGKYVAPFDTKTLLKELKIYSKDDVARMSFLNSNQAIFNERVEKATNIIHEKNKVSRSIYKTNNLIKTLDNYDPKLSVKGLKSKLDKEIQKLEKEKETLDDNFDNF